MGSQRHIVLSIHYGHNATVALAIDGRLVACLSEERLCRIKNATGFPLAAIREILSRFLEGNPGSIDEVIFSDFTLSGYKYLLANGIEPKRYIDYYSTLYDGQIPTLVAEPEIPPPGLPEIISHEFNATIASKHLGNILGIDPSKITFIDHHEAHAYSCLYFMDTQQPRLIFTMDAEGDGVSSAVHKWNGQRLETISSNSRHHSLGYLFSEITAFLGMKSNEHEFKVMGMAPYADPERSKKVLDKLKKIIAIDEKGQVKSSISTVNLRGYLIRNLTYERFDSICGAIQSLTEELTRDWVEYWIKSLESSQLPFRVASL